MMIMCDLLLLLPIPVALLSLDVCYLIIGQGRRRGSRDADDEGRMFNALFCPSACALLLQVWFTLVSRRKSHISRQ